MQNENGISHIRMPPGSSGWIEATIQFVNAGEEDIGTFVDGCMELGAVGGAETAGEGEVEAGQEGPCGSCGPSTNVRVYFPESTGIPQSVDLLEAGIRSLQRSPRSPGMRARILQCRKIAREEWATRWKGGFPPEKVSALFWVVPPWESHPAISEGAVPLVLEPGQAFGTGKHCTTRHCLAFLEEVAGNEGGLPPSFLDVGCGSGILSIAARRLGAGRVVGLDIDPDALCVARRNLELNRIFGEVLLVNGSPACLRAGFDLIAANLDATTLLRHGVSLRSIVARGGVAILSGMLTEEAPGVLASFEEAGFRAVAEKTEHEEGWTSLLLRAP